MKPGGMIVAATLVAAGLVVSAQQAVFRTGVQYVSVDVVVTDKDDKPVTDLTKDDFVITEKGRPQVIKDFEHISIPLGTATVDLDAPPPPASDVGYNPPSARTGRAIVFMIDDLSLRAEDLIPIKRAMAQFISLLSPDDQVAMRYTRRSDLGHDFTSDHGRLIEAVNKRRDALGLGGGGSPGRDRIYSLRYVIDVLASARHTRRAIVLVTASACRPDMAGSECHALAMQARQADVPIYTLDPRVFTDPVFNAGIGNVNTPEQAATLMSQSGADALSLETLASATGGRAFRGMSDIPQAINDLMVDNSNYYLLGFYPEPIVNDGKFHDITVTVKRPGLRVRARPGYTTGPATPVASTPHRDMTASLGAGIDDPSLPIRVFAAPLEKTKEGTRTVVTIELTYPREAGDTKLINDELRVGILALTVDAKIKASFQRPITMTGLWKPTSRGTFLINETIDLPNEKLSLRVGVTSKALAKTGTAHVYVDVPDFSDNELQLTPLVIGAPKGQTPDGATGMNLIRPYVPFQPATWRDFTTKDTIRIYGRALWKSNDTEADVTITVTGPSSPPPTQIKVEGTVAPDKRRTATIDGEIPLTGLAPGSYVLRVEGKLGKKKPAVREVPFTVK
jgi:VWFA-related protein